MQDQDIVLHFYNLCLIRDIDMKPVLIDLPISHHGVQHSKQLFLESQVNFPKTIKGNFVVDHVLCKDDQFQQNKSDDRPLLQKNQNRLRKIRSDNCLKALDPSILLNRKKPEFTQQSNTFINRRIIIPSFNSQSPLTKAFSINSNVPKLSDIKINSPVRFRSQSNSNKKFLSGYRIQIAPEEYINDEEPFDENDHFRKIEEQDSQLYSNLFKNTFSMQYSTGIPIRLRKPSTDEEQSISSDFFSCQNPPTSSNTNNIDITFN